MSENKREEEQVVVFNLRDQTYGIDIDSVLEIIRMESIVRVPGTPDFVEGIINLRGRIVPVMDLSRWFGLDTADITASSRIIIVDTSDSTIGMIVDSVSEVLRFPLSCIEPPPAMVGAGNVEFIRGVALYDQRMFILLDLARILRDDEKTVLNRMDTEAMKSLV